MNINYDYDYGYFENPFAQIFENDLDADFVIFPNEKRDTSLKGRVSPDYQQKDLVLPEVFSWVENPFLCKSFKTEDKDFADFEFLKPYPSLADTHKNIATLQGLEVKAKAGLTAPVLSTLIKVFEFLKTRLNYLIFSGLTALHVIRPVDSLSLPKELKED